MEGELSSRNGPVRVLIVDDHYLIRSGLRNMLANVSDVLVVGEAENGKEAVELCRESRPDVVLMDVRMPKMDGLEATREIKKEGLVVSVLMLTTHENPEYLLQAMKAGAAGYLIKDAPMQQLISAIRRVVNGETPVNQELAAILIQRLASEAASRPEAASGASGERKNSGVLLTQRELDVLRLMAQGQSNPQIAKQLVISRGTVKGHVQHVIAKLGASDRTQAVVRAIEMGFLTTDAV